MVTYFKNDQINPMIEKMIEKITYNSKVWDYLDLDLPQIITLESPTSTEILEVANTLLTPEDSTRKPQTFTINYNADLLKKGKSLKDKK